MKIRDLHPDLGRVSLDRFFEVVKWGTIYNLFPQIAEFYNSRLSMVRILNYYGMDYVTEGVDHMQVNCLLLEHGSDDFNKSARYFSYDRNTGDAKEGVYCYKCQKYLTPFWYLYAIEKERKKITLLEFFQFVKRIFRVDFPRNLVLDFDPDSYYTFDDVGERQNVLSLFSYAKSLRELKRDPEIYLKSIIEFYRSMKIGG